jgi:hypothetical protein
LSEATSDFTVARPTTLSSKPNDIVISPLLFPIILLFDIVEPFRVGMSGYKSAISITLDDECIRYLSTKVGKRSHYVNRLILSDMQLNLETKKTVWISCKVCTERMKEGQECAYCIIDAMQTRLEVKE